MLRSSTAGLFFAALCLFAEAGWSAEPPVSFKGAVAPLLARKCLTCHGPEKAKGNYRVDTFARFTTPGDSGRAPIVARDADASHLYRLLVTSDADDRMPQKDEALPAAQVALVRHWIEEGALFDGSDVNAALADLIQRPPYPQAPESYPLPVPILALAWQPGADRLAVSGYHEVSLWNATNAALVQRLGQMPQRVHSLEFSTNSHRLLVAGGLPGRDGEVRLTDLATTASRSIALGADVFLSAHFSPDEETVACGGADSALRVIRTRDLQELRNIPAHADWILDLAYSGDGKLLATASRDRTSRVWNVASGELESTYTGLAGRNTAVAFLGSDLVTGGAGGRLHFWKLAEGKKLGEAGESPVEILRLVARNDLVFAADAAGAIFQYAARDRKRVRKFEGHRSAVYALALNARGDLLASGSHDGEVRIWEVSSGKLVRSWIAAPGLKHRQ